VKFCSGRGATSANPCGAVDQLTTAQINALTTNGTPQGTPLINVNTAATNVLADAAARYPANDFTTGDGLNTGGFRFNARIPQAQNTHTARLDWNVTSDDAHKVSFRSTFQDDFVDSAQRFPDTMGTRRINRPFNIGVSHNWLLSSSQVNTFRYGWTRQKFKDTGDTNGDTITFRGVFSPFNFDYPFSRQTDTHNFIDDFSWTIGSHVLQFGGNIRLVRNKRADETASHDIAIINRSFFSGSGNDKPGNRNALHHPLRRHPVRTRCYGGGIREVFGLPVQHQFRYKRAAAHSWNAYHPQVRNRGI
jgi:methionine-rich copper-binding protein CopC